MPRRLVYVVALSYAPGMYKEVRVWRTELERLGWEVRFLLSAKYSWMVQPEDSAVFVETDTSLRDLAKGLTLGLGALASAMTALPRQSPSALFFYNTHPFNELLLRAMKRELPELRVVSVLHEPYKVNKSVYSLRDRWHQLAAEALQRRVVSLSDAAVTLSAMGRGRYEQYYSNAAVPLVGGRILIPDTDKARLPRRERRYISFIGRVNSGKSLRPLTRIAIGAHTIGLDIEVVAIVGRNSSAVAKKQRLSMRSAGVRCEFRERLSDTEIEDVVRHSLAVVLTHSELTQSGTVPVAYREGTPILARRIEGFEQDIHHGRTGFLLESQWQVEEVVGVLDLLERDFDRLSRTSRKQYEERHHPSQWVEYYRELLQLLDGAHSWRP